MVALRFFDVEPGGEGGGDGAIRLGVSNEIRDLTPGVNNCDDVALLLVGVVGGSEGEVCILSR